MLLFGFNATLANCVRNADVAIASAAAYALTLTTPLLLLLMFFVSALAVGSFRFPFAPDVVRVCLLLLFRVSAILHRHASTLS